MSTKKPFKVVLDIAVSAVMFLIFAILLDWIASLIFGKTVKTDGSSTVNFNGGVLLAITTLLTIVFATWFYKFLMSHSVSKIEKQ